MLGSALNDPSPSVEAEELMHALPLALPLVLEVTLKRGVGDTNKGEEEARGVDVALAP